jgi:hypothetical protein
MASPEDTADCLWHPPDLLRYFFDRPLDEFYAHKVEFGLGPAAMIDTPLDPVLDDEAQTCLFGVAGTALQSNHALFELAS